MNLFAPKSAWIATIGFFATVAVVLIVIFWQTSDTPPTRVSAAAIIPITANGALTAPQASSGGVPGLVTFQGVLTDSGGSPISDGSRNVTFSVHDADTGGTQLWSETQNISTSSGLFTALLGSSTAFPNGLFDGTPRYLQVQVESDPPLSPRQQFVSVPYSLSSADGVPSGSSVLGTSPTAPDGYTIVDAMWGEAQSWAIKASMSTPRKFLGVAVVGSKIYVVGGRGPSGNPLATVEEYDPATDTWVPKADMPTARHHLAVAAVGGKIYAIGGTDGTVKLDVVEEYDPATDTWATRASMPTARQGLAAAALNGKVYAMGGRDQAANETIGAVEEYDPASDTWITKGDMSVAREDHAAVTATGAIYTLAGIPGGTNGVFRYDPGPDTWTKLPGVAEYNGHRPAVGIADAIHLMLSDSSSPAVRPVRLDLSNNMWIGGTAGGSALPDGAGAAAVAGKIYVFGGEDPPVASDSVSEYTPPTRFFVYEKD